MMKKRYVIYSAMVGAYDDILQPLIVDERFDYILFCNEIKEKRVGVWKVCPIMYHNDDRTRICRYVKTHPEKMVKEYEVSVWMDSNVQIQTKEFYNQVVVLDTQDILFSSTWHPTRHCIYTEAFAVMNMRVEYEDVVIDWCAYLRNEHYPQNNGLYETCVLYRKHNHPQVMQSDNLWWSIIERYSRRDQLSCNYVLWKIGLPPHYLLGEGKHVENVDSLRQVHHKDQKYNHCPLKKNEAWLMRHLWKQPEDDKKIEDLYFRLYAYPCPKLWIALAGQYYRIIDWLKRKA